MGRTTFSGPVVSLGGFQGPLLGPFTGNLTGNVTGDVTGDLTGNVTGDLTGNVTGDVVGAIQLPTYTVATAPSASTAGAGTLIYVSDGAGGSPILAFSDGTDWKRSDTGATISGA